MSKLIDFTAGVSSIPDYFLDSIQEFIGMSAPNFKIELVNATTIKVPGGVGNAKASIGIANAAGTAMGWRMRESEITAAHPGGAAGEYDIFVTAYANDFTGTPPNIDQTNYAFGLTIKASGATPSGAGSEAYYRKVGSLTWDGAAITSLKPSIADTVLPATAAPLVDGIAAVGVSDKYARQDHVHPTSFDAGIIVDFGGLLASVPAKFVPCDGRALVRDDFVALFAAIGTLWDTFGGLAAPAVTHFRVPDFRGRGRIHPYLLGGGPALIGAAITRAVAVAGLWGTEYHTLTIAQMPSHSHTGATGVRSAGHTHTGTSGNQSADHSHTGTSGIPSDNHTHSGATAGRSAAHVHYDSGHSHDSAGSTQNGGDASSNVLVVGYNNLGDKAFLRSGYANLGTESADHTHGFTTGTVSAWHTHVTTTGGASVNHTHTTTTGVESADHTHAITAEGGGGAHENVFPVAVCPAMIATGGI